VKFLLNFPFKIGHFEWIDGLLIRALKYGWWLLIDNANLCQPSVLDRLNPLLEPNGSLILSERGINDGAVEEVKNGKIFPRLIFFFSRLNHILISDYF
jgi:midasin